MTFTRSMGTEGLSLEFPQRCRGRRVRSEDLSDARRPGRQIRPANREAYERYAATDPLALPEALLSPSQALACAIAAA